MKWFKLGQGSVIIRVKIKDSTSSSGAGKTGLSSASSGLIISTIADNEASATAYTQASSNIEGITTLGTFAAPTAGKCRFAEVDSTNHKGLYEIQIADTRWGVSNAKSLIVSISGASGAAECDIEIPLTSVDPYDGVHFGITALPNAAAEAPGGLFTRGTGAGQVNQDASGRLDVNIATVLSDATSATNLKAYTNGTTAAPVNVTEFGGEAGTFSAGRAEVNVTHFGGNPGTFSGGIPSVNTIQWRGVQPSALITGRLDTNVGAMQADVLTAEAIAADAIGASELAADAATEIAAAIKALVIETNGSVTFGQAMSVMLAVLSGITANGGNTFKDPSGTSTRVTATTDGSNNRTAMSLTPSA